MLILYCQPSVGATFFLASSLFLSFGRHLGGARTNASQVGASTSMGQNAEQAKGELPFVVVVV